MGSLRSSSNHDGASWSGLQERDENARTARASHCCNSRPFVTRVSAAKDIIMIFKDSSLDHSSRILVVFAVHPL